MSVQDRDPRGPLAGASPPEHVLLDEVMLHRALVEEGPYARLVRQPSLDSTNAELARLVADPGFHQEWPHLSVLTAEEQTGGRGRLAREWSSPAGQSLSTSLVLRPAVSPDLYPWLSLLAGVALAEVLRAEHGLAAHLKWPNDVHIEGRKVSGILASIAGDAVVLGIGINVLQEAGELPTPQSTSVLAERARAGRATPDAGMPARASLRTQLLVSVLLAFAELLRQLEAAGTRAVTLPGSVLQRVTAVMDTLGAEVRLELPDGTAVRGHAVELAGQGAILVEVTHRREAAESGEGVQWVPAAPERRAFSVGDVTHLRRWERR